MKNRILAASAALLLLGSLTACSGQKVEAPEEAAVSDTTNEVKTETPASAQTIADAFEKIGCAEDYPAGTKGMIDEPGDFDYVPEMIMNGTCRPIVGGNTVAFFQYASPSDAEEAAANGSIEALPGELFIDGSVLIWAMDAPEQALAAAVAEPAN